MNRRALAIALAVALISTGILVLYLRKFEREMSGGEPVAVLVAIKQIDRGKVITPEMVSLRTIPVAYVEDRAVKEGERNKITGLETSTTLYPGQTLMWTDLAITTEDRDLSTLIQPGKRAVPVRATTMDDTRGNQLIRPGDYVDAVVTMRDEGQDNLQKSVVLLQRVLVLAVGNETQTTGGPVDPKARQGTTGSRDKWLTLSLTLPEAQLLSLALERGRLSVAVRNPEDPSVQDDIPDMKSDALTDSRRRAEIQRAPRTRSDGPVRIESAGIR